MAAPIRIAASDGETLSALLKDNGVSSTKAEAKGVGEFQMLIVALGGGAGIAAVAGGLAKAIKAYFDGRAAVEKEKTLEITIGTKKVKMTGSNYEAGLKELVPLLQK